MSYIDCQRRPQSVVLTAATESVFHRMDIGHECC